MFQYIVGTNKAQYRLVLNDEKDENDENDDDFHSLQWTKYLILTRQKYS